MNQEREAISLRLTRLHHAALFLEIFLETGGACRSRWENKARKTGAKGSQGLRSAAAETGTKSVTVKVAPLSTGLWESYLMALDGLTDRLQRMASGAGGGG